MAEKLNIDDIAIQDDYIKSVIKNRDYNRLIESHYGKLFDNTHEEKFLRAQDRMIDCNSIWILDHYKKAHIKDFQRTNLCKDKFCSNCKKVKQAYRLGKFSPSLRNYADNLYLLTLTVPNVSGKDLKATIDKMFSSFRQLIRYMRGANTLKGIDFESWGYEGAIRSLEVTYKKVKKGRGFRNEYHPHIHALVVLNGDFSQRDFENVFSKDFLGKKELRKFSYGEILIQGIWRLLNEGKRVSLKTIQELDKGYSCRLDKSGLNDYMEIFKYMTKSTSEDGTGIEYQQFEDLYYALLNKRQIRGYGCFYNVKDSVDELTLEEMDKAYDAYIESLKQEESPQRVLQTPEDSLADTENKYISRKRFYQYLRSLKD